MKSENIDEPSTVSSSGTTDAVVIATALQRSAERKRADEEALIRARPRQMALFKEDMRAISSDLARSPLFAPIRSGRRSLRDGQLSSPSGVRIDYKGEQLDQGDCDVFMQLVHEARGRTLGVDYPIKINRAELLQQTGRRDGGANYTWLAASLSRLRDGKLTIENDRYKIETSMILKVITDKDEGKFEVIFDPDIVKMFTGSEFTLVEWKKRQLFEKRVELAKWLHNFTSSHKTGVQKFTLEKLRDWTGQKSPIRKFREALSEAMDELARVGIVAGVEFYDDGTKIRWTRL